MNTFPAWNLLLQILIISRVYTATEIANVCFCLGGILSYKNDTCTNIEIKTSTIQQIYIFTFSFFGLFGMSSGVQYPGEGWYRFIDELNRLDTKQGCLLAKFGHMTSSFHSWSCDLKGLKIWRDIENMIQKKKRGINIYIHREKTCL